MPQTRQPAEAAIAVRSLGLRLPSQHAIEPHAHPWPQLVYASDGVLTVSTGGGAWVVPPERAVWIPPGFEHAVRTTGEVAMRTLYLRPDLAHSLPTRCGVVGVDGLLRELVLEVVRRGMLRDDVEAEAHLAAVLVDRIAETRVAPLEVRLPTDPRARHVARAVREDLSTPRTLAELAPGSGASERTIERLFRRETGLSFGRWVQRARALHALERLAAGDSVTEAGLAVGYDSTSAFIAMFQRVLGTTPGRYF